jgi:cobalt-zinc-cadmium efflux system membrane fusion protein
MRRRVKLWRSAAAAILMTSLLVVGLDACSKHAAEPAPAIDTAQNTRSVTLTDAQSKAIQVGPVTDQTFLLTKEAVGSIDFDEHLSMPVFTPYPGRIIKAYVDLGDKVVKGQVLYTIESPDFLQAESTLISAHATYDQAHSAAVRAKRLYASEGIDQNDYEQAVAAEASADGALKAARQAVAIFGLSAGETDALIAKHQVDPALVVRSPITGVITARNAAPGLLAQPGVAPAPYSVADTTNLWFLANVVEEDSPAFKVGQEIDVTVEAYPGRVFKSKITAVGLNVDAVTHRVTLRAEIHDPGHELRAGMLANFVIHTGAPVASPAVPLNGVVREGDGTMSVWVTTDRRHFERRTVQIGLRQNDYDQILAGVKSGETIAVDGAIFLSNLAFGGPT